MHTNQNFIGASLCATHETDLFLILFCFLWACLYLHIDLAKFINFSLKEYQNMTVIVAIDGGNGHFKFVKSHTKEKIITSKFPSIAIVPHRGGLTYKGILKDESSQKVTIGDSEFECGLGVNTVKEARNVPRDFYQTTQYEACMKAALKDIGKNNIDLLVLGAPVANYSTVAPFLEKKYTGQIEIHRGEKRFVNVSKVLVLPQPLGSLYACIKESPFGPKLQNMRVLTIDSGNLSFDWLYTSNDNGQLVADKAVSGSHFGGMDGIIKLILAEISERIGTGPIDGAGQFAEVEAAIRKAISAVDESGDLLLAFRGKKVVIKGQEFDLISFADLVKMSTSKAIDALLANVGSSEIDAVILTGGGGPLFLKEIMARVSKKIVTPEEMQTANARGYQYAGETLLGVPYSE